MPSSGKASPKAAARSSPAGKRRGHSPSTAASKPSTDAFAAYFNRDCPAAASTRLKALIDRVRSRLHEKVAAKANVSLSEAITWGVPTWKLNGKNLCHAGGFQAHVSLFPGAAPVAQLTADLRKAKGVGFEKGSIRFNLQPDAAWDDKRWALIDAITDAAFDGAVTRVASGAKPTSKPASSKAAPATRKASPKKGLTTPVKKTMKRSPAKGVAKK